MPVLSCLHVLFVTACHNMKELPPTHFQLLLVNHIIYVQENLYGIFFVLNKFPIMIRFCYWWSIQLMSLTSLRLQYLYITQQWAWHTFLTLFSFFLTHSPLNWPWVLLWIHVPYSICDIISFMVKLNFCWVTKSFGSYWYSWCSNVVKQAPWKMHEKNLSWQ